MIVQIRSTVTELINLLSAHDNSIPTSLFSNSPILFIAFIKTLFRFSFHHILLHVLCFTLHLLYFSISFCLGGKAIHKHNIKVIFNGYPFSTKDRDNDASNAFTCAMDYNFMVLGGTEVVKTSI